MEIGKLLIGGKWLESHKLVESTNPANGRAIGKISFASTEDVRQAVTAARTSLKDWRKKDMWERSKVLLRVADEIQKDVDKYARLITTEMGRPLLESEIEVNETCDMIRYFANEGKAFLEGEAIPIDPALFPNKFSFTRFEPVGVVAVIKPWNYPLELPFWAIAPALLAGNTVVFKPSELTPFVGIEIGKICQTANVPDGVINVVPGDGSTGESLVRSDVDMISFTGSYETGKKIMETPGLHLHRVSLELGGSDPAIVFNDADFDEAINGTLWGRFANCGQVCAAAKRIFVQKDIAERFIHEFLEKTKHLVIGSGLDRGTDIGPMVSGEQRDRVYRQVRDAVDRGARVECGGKIPTSHKEGFYFEPTVLTHVAEDMKITCEEVFGPIAPIITFGDEGEVIEQANRTRYGLGASIWTDDLDKAIRVSGLLDAGTVWVNDINVAFAQCPWGGVKDSGIGRELSKYGVREFVNVKHVNVDYGSEKTRAWWFPYKK